MLIIYPNPSSKSITIELPGPAPEFPISIFNFSGMEVITQQASGSSTDLDISTLPAGIYIVRVVDESSVLVGKFVKQ
jgi:hypothetical protein